MKQSKTPDIIIIILSVLILGISLANIRNGTEPEQQQKSISVKEEHIETPTPTPTPKPEKIRAERDGGTFQPYLTTYWQIKLTKKGRYFITAYCPAECGGSWATASGATCHRADDGDRLESPTTCAIDRKKHSFGTYFYIEEFDRIFVAEDTGSAVKNNHLDLFYEEMSDVQAFPTGYYTVYTVEYIKKTAIVTEEADEAFQTMSPTDYYRDITYN